MKKGGTDISKFQNSDNADARTFLNIFLKTKNKRNRFSPRISAHTAKIHEKTEAKKFCATVLVGSFVPALHKFTY
jgi:hypothetical protein